jgi:hypothetical protein
LTQILRQQRGSVVPHLTPSPLADARHLEVRALPEVGFGPRIRPAPLPADGAARRSGVARRRSVMTRVQVWSAIAPGAGLGLQSADKYRRCAPPIPSRDLEGARNLGFAFKRISQLCRMCGTCGSLDVGQADGFDDAADAIGRHAQRSRQRRRRAIMFHATSSDARALGQLTATTRTLVRRRELSHGALSFGALPLIEITPNGGLINEHLLRRRPHARTRTR